MNPRPPLPTFTEESARQKVQAAEDAWNSRDPERVSLAYFQEMQLQRELLALAEDGAPYHWP